MQDLRVRPKRRNVSTKEHAKPGMHAHPNNDMKYGKGKGNGKIRLISVPPAHGASHRALKRNLPSHLFSTLILQMMMMRTQTLTC
jgi:hypothetical protein